MEMVTWRGRKSRQRVISRVLGRSWRDLVEILSEVEAKTGARKAKLAASCSNMSQDSAKIGHDNNEIIDTGIICMCLMPRAVRAVVFLN